MAESRQELINWVNDLLLINMTKVEQCGTGAIFCQILDSIYMDVPMSKVRFDVNSEYQYLNNLKVLQSVFTKYAIDRTIPVEKLVKCRFQDNLEFLQWIRRYWDANFPGHEYDPQARRKSPLPISLGGGAPASSTAHPGPSRMAPKPRAAPAMSNSRQSSTSNPPPARRPPSVQRGSGVATPALTAANNKVQELTEENEQLVSAVDLVESERDFYFQKLRDIEVLIQNAAEQLDEEGAGQGEEELEDSMAKLDVNSKAHSQLIREIQTILYSTAEGFEIPTQEFETEETF